MRTFMTATCPVDNGAANTGQIPPELTVSRAVTFPFAPTARDCKAERLSLNSLVVLNNTDI